PCRRTCSPHPVDRQPADQAAGRHVGTSAPRTERQAGDADPGGRAAPVVRTADSRARTGSARRCRTTHRGWHPEAWNPGGFCRLPVAGIAVRLRALASELTTRHPLRVEHHAPARARTWRTRPRIV